MTYEAAEWLEFVGGASPYREAVKHAFSGTFDELGGESIEILANKLEVYVSVVFCDTGHALEAIEQRSSDHDRCVIAIIPDLDLAVFRRALVAGAQGMVWEDTPTGHLVAVTRAALHGDFLMPAQVVLSILTDVDTDGGAETNSHQSPAAAPDLDPASVTLLHALSAGRAIKEIAEEMAYSDRTIQRKITNLCLMLGAQTPAEAVHIAHRRHLLL